MNDLLNNDDADLIGNFDLLENFENLLVDNIYLDGDELNIDLNVNIDLPDYLQNLTEASMMT